MPALRGRIFSVRTKMYHASGKLCDSLLRNLQVMFWPQIYVPSGQLLVATKCIQVVIWLITTLVLFLNECLSFNSLPSMWATEFMSDR